ncbi:PREDICTED: uncharacterized protein LOC106803503 [Ceratotherium simum simum]|uniref:Uncharacterized protein LOC106803503 n=1 Tax=Ceratotherium simum simum TaxID=73337 RepID=A0ABM1DFK7_CERSS|nr:PREDICTED: uncharacterized protein LOC106803503 [Ceratotherium simum simum]
MLSKTESTNYSSQVSNRDHPPRTGSWPTTRAKVDVPPSLTHSPEASIKSVESIIWTSQETSKASTDSSQFNQSTLDSNILSSPSGNFVEVNSGGCQNRRRRSHSLLPIGWWLLHEAKKISHLLSLALSLVGMMIIGLISLGQPWIHFRVPLTPPGDPAGSLTIPINTIFFVRCPDISCLHEYDQNAYLLDLSWAFLVIASIASCCLCIILIHINFFTSSNVLVLDFSNTILSILTGMALKSSLRTPGEEYLTQCLS